MRVNHFPSFGLLAAMVILALTPAESGTLDNVVEYICDFEPSVDLPSNVSIFECESAFDESLVQYWMEGNDVEIPADDHSYYCWVLHTWKNCIAKRIGSVCGNKTQHVAAILTISKLVNSDSDREMRQFQYCDDSTKIHFKQIFKYGEQSSWGESSSYSYTSWTVCMHFTCETISSFQY